MPPGPRPRVDHYGREAAGECRALVVHPDRSAYVGLLGAPAWRVFGAIAIYGALRHPFRIRTRDGEWVESALAVVPAGTAHRITSRDHNIGCALVEPESVARDALPFFLRPGPERPSDPGFAARVLRGFDLLPRVAADLRPEDFDRLFFSRPLAERRLDPRILHAVRCVKENPSGALDAESLAARVGLSFSRFLHLFTLECGVPFRRFRMWKRARSFLLHVARESRMIDVALDVGYPDSAHFSRSIRRFYGLTPSDIFAGSRGLPVFVQPGAPEARPGRPA